MPLVYGNGDGDDDDGDSDTVEDAYMNIMDTVNVQVPNNISFGV